MPKYIQIPLEDESPPEDAYGEYALIRLGGQPAEILQGIYELLIRLGEKSSACLELHRPSDVIKDVNALVFFSRECPLTRDYGTSTTVDFLLGKRSRSQPVGQSAAPSVPSSSAVSLPADHKPSALLSVTPTVLPTVSQSSPVDWKPVVAAPPLTPPTTSRSVALNPAPTPLTPPLVSVTAQQLTALGAPIKSEQSPSGEWRSEDEGMAVAASTMSIDKEHREDVVMEEEKENEKEAPLGESDSQHSNSACSPIGGKKEEEEGQKVDSNPSESAQEIVAVKDEHLPKAPVNATPSVPLTKTSSATAKQEELPPKQPSASLGTMASDATAADVVQQPAPSLDAGATSTAQSTTKWHLSTELCSVVEMSVVEMSPSPKCRLLSQLLSSSEKDGTAAVLEATHVSSTQGATLTAQPTIPSEKVPSTVAVDNSAKAEPFCAHPGDSKIPSSASPLDEVGDEIVYESFEEVGEKVIVGSKDEEKKQDCRSTATAPGPFVADDNGGSNDFASDEVQKHEGENASRIPITLDVDSPMSDATTPPQDPSPAASSSENVEPTPSVIQANPQSSTPLSSKPVIASSNPVASLLSAQKSPLKSCLKNSTQSQNLMPSQIMYTPKIPKVAPATVSTATSTPIADKNSPAPSTPVVKQLPGEDLMAYMIRKKGLELELERAAAKAANPDESSTDSPPPKKMKVDDIDETTSARPPPVLDPDLMAFLDSRPVILTPFQRAQIKKEADAAAALAAPKRDRIHAVAATLESAKRKRALESLSGENQPPPRTPAATPSAATRVFTKRSPPSTTPLVRSTPVAGKPSRRPHPTTPASHSPDSCLTPSMSSSSSSPSSDDSSPSSDSTPQKTSRSVKGAARRKQTLKRTPSPDETTTQVQKNGILKDANGTRKFGDQQRAENKEDDDISTHVRCNVSDCNKLFRTDKKNSRQLIRYHVLLHCPLKKHHCHFCRLAWGNGWNGWITDKRLNKNHEPAKVERHQKKKHRLLTKDQWKIDCFDNVLYTGMYEVYVKKCFPNFDMGKLAIGANLNRPNILDDLHSCSVCNTKHYTSLLPFHIMDRHVEMVMYTCDECPFKTVRKRHLVLHQQACHQRPGSMDVVGEKYLFETGVEYIVKEFFPTFVDSKKGDPPEVVRLAEVMRPSFNMDAEMRTLNAELDGLSHIIEHPPKISETTCMVCFKEASISKFTDLYNMVMHTKSHIVEQSKFQWQCPEEGCSFRGRYRIFVDHHMMETHEESQDTAINRWDVLWGTYYDMFGRCFPSHKDKWPTSYNMIDARCCQDSHPCDPAQAGLLMPKSEESLSDDFLDIKPDPAFFAFVDIKSE